MHKIDWIFGYGSLMWDPGFHPAETVKARLPGYARRFCLLSTSYRGTAEAPGLVLGLDRDDGAECCGLAMRIAPNNQAEVLAYLHAREMSDEAYAETILPLTLEDGRQISALTYVIQQDHWQYAGDVPDEEQARIIARASGARGPNADYLFNTTQHLAQIGLADPALERLSGRVRDLLALTAPGCSNSRKT